MSKQLRTRLVLSLMGLLLIAGCGGSGGGGDGGSKTVGSSDMTPPTVPTELTVTALSTNQIEIQWSASTDAVGVTGYLISRGGTSLTTANTTMTDTDLTATTQYCYQVAAYDYAGNASEKSSLVCATTLTPNDSFSSAQTISAGIDYLGENNSGKYDYSKVTAEGSSMTVSLSHLTANAFSSDFDVYIYNSSQAEIAHFSASNGIGNSMTTGVTSGQTYYIKVYVIYGDAYQYKLKASFGSAYYELEPNDDFATAQSIAAGLDYTGQNNGSDSNDYFKVVATGSSMTVSLSHDYYNFSGSDFDVYIYNSSQAQIAYFSASNGIDNSMTTGVTSGQTYYIKVYAGNADTFFQYKLKASFSGTSYEQEPNDDFATAQPITADIYYIGQKDNGSDSNDYFKVTASGSSMTVSLAHVTANASGSDFSVDIYNSSQGLAANYFYASNGIDNSNFVTGLTTQATYYIKISVGYSGSYQYKLKVSFP